MGLSLEPLNEIVPLFYYKVTAWRLFVFLMIAYFPKQIMIYQSLAFLWVNVLIFWVEQKPLSSVEWLQPITLTSLKQERTQPHCTCGPSWARVL